MTKFSLAVHGGAGVIAKSSVTAAQQVVYEKALAAAVNVGCQVLEKGGTPLEGATAAVVFLEDCPLFNAGRGAVFTIAGTHELEAAVMDSHGKIGIVSGLSRTKNPILLAKHLAEKMPSTNHLSGETAETRLLSETGLTCVENSYFSTDLRLAQLDKVRAKNAGPDAPLDHNVKIDPSTVNYDVLFAEVDKVLLDHGQSGTVGAVAWVEGQGVAAATSTGGLTGKPVGRLGDTPVIGASTWANSETLAVSTTGTGEKIMAAVAAYDIHARMKYSGEDLATATRETLGSMPEGSCGCVCVDAKTGEVVMDLNTGGMFRGSIDVSGQVEVAIWK